MILDSGIEDGCRGSRHCSYLFLEPLCRIVGRDRAAGVELAGGRVIRRGQGLDCIKSWLIPFMESNWPRDMEVVPISAGFAAYELLEELEQIELPRRDVYQTPRSLFYLYRTVLEVPCDPERDCRIVRFTPPGMETPFWKAGDPIKLIEESLCSPAPPPRAAVLRGASDLSGLEQFSNFTRAGYERHVERIREMIARGEVYQVNLSQQFVLPYSGDAGRYFTELRSESPASYGAYLHCGGGRNMSPFSVVSSSPELFLESSGGEARTSPIKGTCPRGACADDDIRARRSLLASAKDLAELAMIVDLERNDLGKVAIAGSVAVDAYPRLESYAHVHHLMADVSCRLADGVDQVDLIRAAFPCGSITGAPKIAAMKVISRLERSQRGVYSGAIGAFGAQGLMKLNVAIRTAIVSRGQLIFQTGGGIVFDSDPALEYDETLHKAAGLYEAWKRCVLLSEEAAA